MDCSMPVFSGLHHLLELAEAHVHWVSDAIQPSHLLSSPSPSAFYLSQHQSFSTESGLCIRWQRIGASASVLPMSIQCWFPFRWTGLISLESKGLSRVFSNTTIQKHQFFGVQAFFMVQFSHSYMTTWKTIALTVLTFVSKVMSLLFNTLSRLPNKIGVIIVVILGL